MPEVLSINNQKIVERFWRLVDIRGEDECWPWKNKPNAYGYGTFYYDGIYCPAHAFGLELKLNRELTGLALHTCDNRICCNQAHLYEGTHTSNMLDMWKRDRHAKPINLPGESARRVSLTEEKVIYIRSSNKTPLQLALELGVARTTIYNILQRATWKHI